ncbi:hypothetical protein [Effusibacillus consociatus]|uniref:Cardiolipin synthase N-terminal domain-containing protein n=1 Tax=Effusibacillus consociatus TaxID=1117041 RepID=A0ABV9PZU3_9BACL
MKWTDWLIALSLICIGLYCLWMSATSMLNMGSIWAYLRTLLQICLWAAIPVILGAVVYLIFKRKGRDL